MTLLQLSSPRGPAAGRTRALAAGPRGVERPEPNSLKTRQQRMLQYLRADRAFPQLIRFALVGGLSNVSYVLLFLSLTGAGPLLANVAGSVVSTALANELHRRLTFHAAQRVGWFTAQWEGGGLALVGLGISTSALAALSVLAPGLSDTAQAAAVLAISAAVGGLRFLALRGLVFRPRSRADRAAATRTHSGAFGQPVEEALVHQGRQHIADITTERRHFLDQ